MDSALRSRIHDLTLWARAHLTTEAHDLLEGVYGLAADGGFEPAAKLPALRDHAEAGATRRRLERFLADERQAGLAPERAYEKLVKEVAFTHLNRLVALKLLEARRLIRPAIDRSHDSNGFKFYLADDEHADDLARFEAGTESRDALGEGPRDVAYRRFLLWQCAQVAGEVRVLFDPDNLPSRLFPRPRALKDLLDRLNAGDLRDAWQSGNEEAIGWVYQYFNEQEKAAVFEGVNKRKQKIQVDEIPAATQLFTPRWIVRFLVENTLGRLWVQMHPESALAQSLEYLVPLAGEVPTAPLKPVGDIAILDPACGTMHFGLVAFDLLVAMYQEEIEHAGQPGWPKHPSAAGLDDIPAAIIERNLDGIDIDLRAVQLSALTLYVKAKSMNRRAAISASNLACGDVLLGSQQLDSFIKEASFTRPIYERLIRAMGERLRHAAMAGSLVRAEVDVADLVRKERARYEREGKQPDLFGVVVHRFEEEAAAAEYWAILEAQIIQAFDEFAREQAKTNGGATFFTGEATKGMRLLDLMLRRYDIVFTNPPYMSDRNMHTELNEFLKNQYPSGKGDLYAAFINRCAELLHEGGRLGMIAQQSFMFISSYEKLRVGLLREHAIETMCHIGPRAFEEIGGEKVNTTLMAIRRETSPRLGLPTEGTYFRLVREPDAEAKRLGFERALGRLRAGEDATAVYRYNQSDFDAIPGSPWVYWTTAGLMRLFQTLPKLGDGNLPRVGLQTGENFRFLRFWWEEGISRISMGCSDSTQAQLTPSRWFPYMKGGPARRWWGNQEYIVNWEDDGAEVRHLGLESGKPGSRPQNTPFYFCRGVTWSKVSSARLAARLSPGASFLM